MENLRGRLLIANGPLFDPNFRQTVVLIVEHGEEGALGMVLNRPSGTTAWDAAAEFQRFAGPSDVVFIGGPVQPEAVIVVAEFERPEMAEKLLFDSVGLLPLDGDDDTMSGVRRTKVFAGYSGWGPGQLESEMEENSWIVEPALPDDVFATEPTELWRRVLKRKGGPYSLMSSMPFDPSSN